MFDIGASELLLIVVVAIVVIGPKDLPMALRAAGRWVAKIRSVSSHFRAGIDTMIREAELEEMEKKWREQNAAIMASTPAAIPDWESTSPVATEPLPAPPAEVRAASTDTGDKSEPQPQLPLTPP